MRMSNRFRKILVGVAAALGVAAPAQAAQDNELEALFAEGMQALEDNRLRTAREAFRAILETEPGLHRAQLELAVTYYRMLDYARAESLAREVLEDPATPPQVRVTISAFLAQIEADRERFGRRHRWNASLAFGGMHDSNVNVGPSSEVLADNIRLTPGSTERSDNALYVTPRINHTFNPGKRVDVGETVASFLWQSQASLYHREYHHEEDFNLSVATLSTGPALVALQDWRAAVDFTVDYIQLGGNDLALFTSANPFVTWQFDRGEITLDATYTLRDYERRIDTEREGDYYKFGGSLARYFFNRKVAVQAGVHYTRFDADADQWGYEGPGAMLAASFSPTSRTRFYARVVQRDLDFDGPFVSPLPALNITRDERERRFNVGFNHEFASGWLEDWRMRGNIARTINGSNLALFEYDRTQISLDLMRGFEL